jgi:CheY-like chemotaxis protein
MTNSRPKILSVDDNRVLNLVRRQVLAVNGFDCHLACTAEQALGLIMTCHYDAILLDYCLPGTNGLQVADTIKTIRPFAPIIVVTGEELQERSDAIHSFIVKGEGPEALINRLKSVVNSKHKNPKSKAAIAS